MSLGSSITRVDTSNDHSTVLGPSEGLYLNDLDPVSNAHWTKSHSECSRSTKSNIFPDCHHSNQICDDHCFLIQSDQYKMNRITHLTMNSGTNSRSDGILDAWLISLSPCSQVSSRSFEEVMWMPRTFTVRFDCDSTPRHDFRSFNSYFRRWTSWIPNIKSQPNEITSRDARYSLSRDETYRDSKPRTEASSGILFASLTRSFTSAEGVHPTLRRVREGGEGLFEVNTVHKADKVHWMRRSCLTRAAT
jgi:hypothetical protein